MQAAIEKYIKKRKLNKDLFRERALLALMLSLVVIAGIFWWLKLVGVTMAGEAFCGMTEHIHSDSCTEKTLICGKEEGDTHTHVEGCYQITYTCGLAEHIHDVTCYSDSKADVETAAVWEETLADVQKGPSFAENLIAVAKSQLGYTESIYNYKIDVAGVRRGYTRYGEWYGNPYGDWNAMFIDFCLHYNGVAYDQLTYYSGVETMRVSWEKIGVYQSADTHTPAAGDILFVDDDADGKADWAGIISMAGNSNYLVIAGDRENSVCEVQLKKDDPSILGSTVETEILSAIATELDNWRIGLAVARIDALPTMDEIAQKLSEYADAGDDDGYATYFMEMVRDTQTAYASWEDLSVYRPLITNGDKLIQYQSMWASALASVDITVHNINKYNTPDILVYGSGTVQSVLGKGMSFLNWNAYTVSRSDAGYYYLSGIDTSDESKLSIKLPTDGFVLLTYRSSGYVWQGVEFGDHVEVPFVYQGVVGNNTSGYGTLSATNSNGLTPIQSADTSGLIEVNLFNYGDKINTMYDQNKYYPGFQQEFGSTSVTSVNGGGSFNFGNNLTVDILAGINGVTTSTGRGPINTTVNGANTPVMGTMNYNLSANGYPQLAYTATGFNPELYWLFSNNAATSTTKLNSASINGLFQQDPVTGKYYFDSRLCFAQYNAEKNIFELYNETMTPNYMMYPFGNFLPFNDINLQATKVTDINRNYFQRMAASALTKHNNGFSTTRNEYQTLSTALTNFVTYMDSNQNNKTWDWMAPIQRYFAVTAPPDISTTDRINGLKDQVSNMYNLDYDQETDFYFGMSMRMDFIMPKNGTTGPNGDQPMVFDFNGDDDVWVYVDGKLFLDLSGIHRHVGGRIDFQNGRVEYYQFNPETGKADISVSTKDALGVEYSYVKDGKTIYYVPFSILMAETVKNDPTVLNEKGTFPDYTTHTIDFFYMERGSGSSVCNIEFNFPLIQQNSVSVTKELTADAEIAAIGNPDFYFQILKENGVTPLVGAGVEYIIMDADNQMEIGKGVTGEGGVFTLKAGQTAVFPGIDENAGKYFVRELLDPTVYEQYGKITVDGKSTTKDHYKPNLTVGAGTFVGVDSDIKDISDGSTAFTFANHIDTHKYGSLKLLKNYLDYQSGLSPKAVTFLIALDGVPIPVGTQYTAITASGIYEIRQVTTAGQITFQSDEIIYFSRIIAGTKITVRESAESAAGYAVTYTASSNLAFATYTDGTGDYGEGIIPAEEVSVTVSNDKVGTKLTVPVNKVLLYSDGKIYTYTFILQQIKSLTDLTEAGIYIKSQVTLTGGPESLAFTLNYVPGTADGKYYYLVYEEGADAKQGMDTTRYIVEITLTTADGKTTAAVTGRYTADGNAITGDDPLTFTNRIVRPLTVSKTVTGITADNRFTFTVNATVDGAPLTGTYLCEDGRSIAFTEGKATFTLAHGESLTILDLPYGTVWTVTEADNAGYFTQYAVNGGEAIAGIEASGTLTDAAAVAYTNAGGYELPSTGSAAHLWFIISGCTLMATALVIGFVLRRRYGRRFN